MLPTSQGPVWREARAVRLPGPARSPRRHTPQDPREKPSGRRAQRGLGFKQQLLGDRPRQSGQLSALTQPGSFSPFLLKIVKTTATATKLLIIFCRILSVPLMFLEYIKEWETRKMRDQLEEHLAAWPTKRGLLRIMASGASYFLLNSMFIW